MQLVVVVTQVAVAADMPAVVAAVTGKVTRQRSIDKRRSLTASPLSFCGATICRDAGSIEKAVSLDPKPETCTVSEPEPKQERLPKCVDSKFFSVPRRCSRLWL